MKTNSNKIKKKRKRLWIIPCAVAVLHRGLLSVTTDLATSYKERMRCFVQGQADSVLLSMIDALPDGNTLCHGDFHPLNIIVTPAGKPYVIDFANLCKAPRQFDIARTYLL